LPLVADLFHFLTAAQEAAAPVGIFTPANKDELLNFLLERTGYKKRLLQNHYYITMNVMYRPYGYRAQPCKKLKLGKKDEIIEIFQTR